MIHAMEDGDPNGLYDQVTARRIAKRQTQKGIPSIAVTVPRGAWGGREIGWTVEVLGPKRKL